MDGIIAGEGNGPIQPLPVEAGVLLASRDPFQMDMMMAHLMGFDYRKIPQLQHHREFGDPEWGNFDPEELVIDNSGSICRGIHGLPVISRFMPAPGWLGHIELGERDDVALEAQPVRVL
jgi:hypothetical protein